MAATMHSFRISTLSKTLIRMVYFLLILFHPLFLCFQGYGVQKRLSTKKIEVGREPYEFESRLCLVCLALNQFLKEKS